MTLERSPRGRGRRFANAKEEDKETSSEKPISDEKKEK